MSTINVPISPGELLDKISILQIKSERISDAEKLKNVSFELKELTTVQEVSFSLQGELKDLFEKLKKVNEELWVIEDDIRDCEREQNFEEAFVSLARSVYFTNDKRAELKKQINIALGSTLVEEKSYASYS
jgi:predicted DNA binding CopG/RHH family protein